MTARSCKMWKFCKQFLRFFGKATPLKSQTVANAWIVSKICQGQISSKLVNFRRSYCRTREDRFCPIIAPTMCHFPANTNYTMRYNLLKVASIKDSHRQYCILKSGITSNYHSKCIKFDVSVGMSVRLFVRSFRAGVKPTLDPSAETI